MKCPVCTNKLTQMDLSGIKVDACDQGCGGIWFDKFELLKFRNLKAAKSEQSLEIQLAPNLKLPELDQLVCPICAPQKMLRRFSSFKRQIHIDECPNCAGVWLDHKELTGVVEEFASPADQLQQTEQYVDQRLRENAGFKSKTAIQHKSPLLFEIIQLVVSRFS